ncbi:hypothetical protein R7Q39_10390 [Vibrio sp. 947]|uniref:hypothetical protein n=1 Tax=Vibrio TaxID=662 RepID=UPI0029656E95|nr:MULTISPECIES: hypothetical protein [unclassified Vibrio]MBE4779873.1 hypothetical protein [Vibrio parahaemolyticus]MDW1584174.1 hypothetical protein [Vibrio sp. Vb2897]MDW1642500.1 hypothetical protein [Vibrio sp. Vb2896]MDW1925824.1 hypothetical protein [Vibrio sp. 947]MDW1966085.1 hypothetical protein [Vibrio sp. Vb0587]
MIYEEIKEHYINHDLVRGNMSILLNFAHIKMLFDSQPPHLDKYALLSPLFRRAIKGSLAPNFAEAGIKRNRPTLDEKKSILSLCAKENIFELEIEFTYQGEKLMINNTDKSDQYFEHNYTMLFRFLELEEQLDWEKITCEQAHELISKDAKEPIFLLSDEIKGNLFFCDITAIKLNALWKKPTELDKRLIESSPESVIQAMREICNVETLKRIIARAESIECESRLKR